jgi:hypothetical protein
MIGKIESLHSAIRRYCIDNHSYWLYKYFELDESKRFENSNYTNEAYSIFPRYNILNALLIEIERFQPKDFNDFEEAKEFFCLISKQSESPFAKSSTNEIAKKVEDEESQKLYAFINQLTDSNLEKVESLFYRRVLSESESQHLREKLREKWNVDGYWFPLSTSKPQNTEAFQDKYFEEDFGFEKLQKKLIELGIQKVFELNEGDINYEMETTVFEPCYGISGNEGFWFDKSFEWLIYASHESSITFAGTVLPKIKESWSNWQERVWTSPFFE